MSGEEVNAACMAFKKALIERALGAELSHHLGYPPGAPRPNVASNQRNGVSGKTVLTDAVPLRIDVPRDRQASFEPVLIPKHERRFTGFDDKIIAMYARGMTIREIQGFLLETYGTEVSPELISSVTDTAMEEITAWHRAWSYVIPFFAFPSEIRRVIYTTNAIESVNASLRKIIKTRGHFPSDDAASKLIWLALRNITAK